MNRETKGMCMGLLCVDFVGGSCVFDVKFADEIRKYYTYVLVGKYNEGCLG